MIKARIDACAPDTANLKDYDQARAQFSWTEMEKTFPGFGAGRINIMTESVDKWAADPEKRDHPALVFDARGRCETYTFRQLRDKSRQWAAMLAGFGFVAGDRLLAFLPVCPETYFAMAACARLGVIFCPVFASANVLSLEIRLEGIGPRGVLTHPDLVEKIPPEFARKLDHILLVNGAAPGIFTNETLIGNLPDRMTGEADPLPLPPDAPLYLIFTSGSTRPPKGIVHTHGDMAGIFSTAGWALDLKPDTLLWTDADPAWVTGTVYGAYAPWLRGVTSLVLGEGFSAANWYRALEKHRVSVWYTTPRVLRDLMDAGDDLPGRYDLSHLRHIAAVGAPLVPDIIYWCRRHLGRTPHDTWWMTETGVVCIANIPSLDIKPGSMGKPLPGIEAAVLDENGQPLPPLSFGQLALRRPWPGMMAGIWQDDARYQRYFLNGEWFLTGDIAVEDEEGYFYHQGRNDDLLKAGGDKLVGPFEIEQLLCMHPAVAEAAVISKGSEPGRGISYLKAFVTPARGYTPSNRLVYAVKAFLKGNLESDLVVGEVEFIDELPKTRSGKLLRRMLRARELGLPGGDPLNMRD